MGIEKSNGGIDKLEKRFKSSSLSKKPFKSNAKYTKDSIKIPNSTSDTVDSASSNAQKSNKANKLNGKIGSDEKPITNSDKNMILNAKNDNFLSSKLDNTSLSKPESISKQEMDSKSESKSKGHRNSKGDDMRISKNRNGHKGKPDNKISNDTSLETNLSNEPESKHGHTLKNIKKNSKPLSKSTADNISNFNLIPDISKLSPKSKQWVGNLFPVLECYNFTLPEILMLIKRNDYNADKIQNAVSIIMQVQSGHEQGQWQTVGVKPKKLKEQDKSKLYNEKVNNYLKALRAEKIEKDEIKQQQHVKRNGDKNKSVQQKNGKNSDENGNELYKENENSSKASQKISSKRGSMDKMLTSKTSSSSHDNSAKSNKTAVMDNKSSGDFVIDVKRSSDQSSSTSNLNNKVSELSIPKLVDMSLSNKAKDDKNAKYDKVDGKLGKNHKDKSFNSENAEHSGKMENVNTAESMDKSDKLQSNTTMKYGFQQIQDRNFQTPQYQYQEFQDKSYPNYPHYTNYGYPEYTQQPMPTFQPYQDPAIITSYPNFKTYQTVMPDMSKYNLNNPPMMIPSYPGGIPNVAYNQHDNVVVNSITNTNDNLRDKISQHELTNNKVLPDGNIGNGAQKHKVNSTTLADSSMWRGQANNIPQSANWKDQSAKDQKKVVPGSSWPKSVDSVREMPMVNSTQGHNYNGNYSIPPGLHSTSYPYSYTSYPYTPNYSGMMYGTQNPQIHSQHMMSYNQYDSNFKCMGEPPGLEGKGKIDGDGNLGPIEHMDSGYKIQPTSNYGKSPYEGIPNPPGLTNYYSQYQPTYGNHGSSYQNNSNWS